jgi:hypothetical protein
MIKSSRSFRSSSLLAALLMLSTAACGGETPDGDTPPQSAGPLNARLSVMSLIAAAVAPQGGGPFDNYLPCVRRGVINYQNTEAGRALLIHGCDLGGGIVMSGSGELSWVGPDLSPSRDTITRMVFTGELNATIEGVDQTAITTFELHDLDYSVSGDRQASPGERLQLRSLAITLHDTTETVSDATLAADIFDTSGMSIDSIPNPGGGVAALTDADTRRLGQHALMYLARVLLNETIESRDAHTHELPCGTLDVTSSQPPDLPIVTASWNGCESLGIFYQGEFTFQWQILNNDVLSMSLQGNPSLTIGGGVPTTEIEELAWTMAIAPELSGAQIYGQLTGADGALDYDFPILVDD